MFITLCAETLPGTNFDRFWVEGKQRVLFQTKEKVEVYIGVLTEIKSREDVDTNGKIELWSTYISETSMTNAEKAAAAAAKSAEEEKSQRATVVVDNDWSAEDVALLTKAI